MKKVILILALALGAINAQGQSDSAFMYYFEDEMSDLTYYVPNREMTVTNEERTKGVKFSTHVSTDGDFLFLTAELIGLGNCCEDNKLIILFEDGSKFDLVSWNDFDCEGAAYFNVTSAQKNKLANIPIKTVRMTNGHSFESVTSSKGYNKRHFIQLFYCIDNRLFKFLED
jgi:hypothetical protein